MASFKGSFVKTNWLDAETASNLTTDPEEVLGLSDFALEVVVTGSPTDCVVLLEGSIDGTSWLVTLTSFNIHSFPGGATYLTATGKPVRYVRLRIDNVTGGTSPTVTASVIGV